MHLTRLNNCQRTRRNTLLIASEIAIVAVAQVETALYINHPSIKRSPMKSDTVLLRGPDGNKDQRVAKLLCEVSLSFA